MRLNNMNRRARAVIRAGGGRMMIDLERVVVIRDGVMVHAPRIVDGPVVAAVENFLTANAGYSDNILHDVELRFPALCYREFFIAYSRWLAAERVLNGGVAHARARS